MCVCENTPACVGHCLSEHNLCRIHMSVCFCAYVCVYVTISGCQLQFCGPEENTAASLRVLLVPLSYRCAGLRLCQFLCVCLRVRVCMHTILLQETKVIPQGFLLGWDLDTWIYQFLSNICSNCCLMVLWEKISKTIFSSCFFLTHLSYKAPRLNAALMFIHCNCF